MLKAQSFFCTFALRRPFSSSCVNLSGHNKWSKIKQRKGANDAKKSAIYAKAYKDIVIAVRNGGSVDPTNNTTLASVLKTAKAQGVPKDNIENALIKATGGKEKGNQYVTYWALAHGSVGIAIECLTDNANRTLHGVRSILTAHNAQFATVNFLFQRKGFVKVTLEKGLDVAAHVEHLIETALEAGAEDFEEVYSSESTTDIEFKCPPNALAKLTTAVTPPETTWELSASELIYSPLEEAESQDEALEGKITELVDALEDNEDTLRIWTTLDN